MEGIYVGSPGQTGKVAELAGVTTFMVNYISEKDSGSSFGGAMVVSSTGEIVEEFPIGIEGILYVDL